MYLAAPRRQFTRSLVAGTTPDVPNALFTHRTLIMLTRIICHAVRTACLVAMLTLAACVPVTGGFDADLDDYFRAATATLAGSWRGFSEPPNDELLTFQLSIAQSGTTVTGSGVMQEKGRSKTLPVTVTGSYNQPRATLTISGMQFEGPAVTGQLRATNRIGYLADTLVLTGANHERMLLVSLSRS